MGKLLILIILIIILAVIIQQGYKALIRWADRDPNDKVFWCACGCDKKFRGGSPWDGYHGPGYERPVTFDAQRLTENKPKAIDYEPENVVGWEDIQWNVEKRLKDER